MTAAPIPTARYARHLMVRLRSDPSTTGIVWQIIPTPAGTTYEIYFSAKDRRFFHEDDLLPLVEMLIEKDTFHTRRTLADLQREILLAKLSMPFGRSLFSLRASRVEFHPYQFKPVIKLLNSMDHRLLIADEVGLGKTIEAGIIITELQARLNLQYIMVVCPASLRMKWRDEMRMRFETEFEILNLSGLRDLFNSYEKNLAPANKHLIVSIEMMRRPEVIQRLTELHFRLDLVIIDEAHHCRNLATQSNELANVLSDQSDALLLLTATPLNLGRADFYNLLHILSPAEFNEIDGLEERMEPVKYLNRASRCIRQNRPEDAYQELIQVEAGSQQHRFIRDPYYQEAKQILSSPGFDHAQAVRAQAALIQLNPISSVFTRTLKREVQLGAPIREARLIRYRFSQPERRFYEDIVQFIRDQWNNDSPESWSVGFALVMRERQAASCLPAFKENLAQVMKELYFDEEDRSMMDEAILDSEPPPASFSEELIRSAQRLKRSAAAIRSTDTKYDAFILILKSVLAEDPAAKILIFSFFRNTLEYLRKRLTQDGITPSVIHGGVEVYERTRVVDTFRDSPNRRVLLSSEVGSEGLDFQFCHILFNYDLPWNPMKVEQRIGRIDRFGQKSKKVSIYNFIADGTVEDRIYARLYERIRIFEESIGDLEAILGDTLRELSRNLYRKQLTAAEEIKLAEEAALAILRQKKSLEELESSKDEFLGQDAIFNQHLADTEETGHFASPAEICALVQTFLNQAFPECQIRQNDGDQSFHMIPSEAFVGHMRHFVLRSGKYPAGNSQFLQNLKPGKVLPIAFIDTIAYQRKLVEFINLRHPICYAAIDYWKSVSDGSAPILLARLRYPAYSGATHLCYVFSLNARSLTEDQSLHSIVLREGDLLENEAFGKTFFKVLQDAEEIEQANLQDIDEAVYRRGKEKAISMMSQISEKRETEIRKRNDARVNVRRAAIETTYRIKMRRVQDALEKVTDERIRRMRRAQLQNLAADQEADLLDLEERRGVSVDFNLVLSACISITA